MMRIRMRWMVTVGALLCGIAASEASARVEVGDLAPPLALEALLQAPDGTDLSWESLAGRTVVVEFWGTWCGPCVRMIPHMNELADELEDDGVLFVAVTYEEPELIERFLKAKPMRAWIGCDTDQSAVDAYGPRGWPTAFVVHDGVVGWIGHPAGLTVDRIREVAAGKRFAEPKRETVEPMKRSRYSAGTDPYSTVAAVPTFQVLLRASLDEQDRGGVSGGGDSTYLGHTVQGLVGRLWGVPRYAITGDAWSEETRFDLVTALPDGMDRNAVDALLKHAVEHGIGMDLTFGTRSVVGYRLRVAEGGSRLKASSEFSPGGGQSGVRDGQRFIEGEHMHTGAVRMLVGWMLDGPTEDATGLDDSYDISFSVPQDASLEELTAALEEQLGLTLVPYETEVRTAHVTRRVDAPE